MPCAPDPDMVECFLEAEKMRTWALELECARVDGRGNKKVWVKKRNPGPFIKAVETVRLPTCPLKLLIP